MNKITQFFSLVRSRLTPKSLLIIGGLLALLFSFYFFFVLKTKESIREHHFVIATDAQWSSLNLKGQERYMQGFVSELLEDIAKDEEIHMTVISVNPSQLFENLDRGYYDAVVSSLSPDVLNEEKYRFSNIFYSTGPVLVVPLNSKVTSLKEISSLGFKSGYSAAFVLSIAPQVSIVYYENINQALSDLAIGKIDGLMLDSVEAYAYIQGYYKDKLKVISAPMNESGLRLLTLHGFFGKKLIHLFDDGVERLKEDKTYDKLLERWDLVNPETAYQK